jgi:hypothetical protein
MPPRGWTKAGCDSRASRGMVSAGAIAFLAFGLFWSRALAAKRGFRHIGESMLHLTKLAVGARDIAHMRDNQAERLANEGVLFHRTRNFPRRAEEVVAGGSIYWVVAGAMLVRQRLIEIREDAWEDGSACASLILDPVLVPVRARPTKPFQGWRYLQAADAPADLAAQEAAEGEDRLPPHLLRELRELCLI